jgi:sec-independent protein translocase protein TatC
MAATALRRPVGHEDRLSLIEHLDELRSRLIISLLILSVAVGLCFAFNGTLLTIINKPLERVTQHNVNKGLGPLGQVAKVEQGTRAVGNDLRDVIAILNRPGSGVSTGTKAALARKQPQIAAHLKALPEVTGNKPVTLGVGEPFSNTLLVSAYFGILLAMPFLLWQLYSFVLPAFSPAERRVALPLLTMIPVLFLLGVVFGYFLVLPAAVRFLQNFNADNFNILVQAKDYYRFAALTLVAMGLVFQVPVGILALVRFGVFTVEKLRRSRRYAFVLCFVIATPLPGIDPVSMIIESLMLYALYEVGILLARLFLRPRADTAEAETPAS